MINVVLINFNIFFWVARKSKAVNELFPGTNRICQQQTWHTAPPARPKDRKGELIHACSSNSSPGVFNLHLLAGHDFNASSPVTNKNECPSS
mmetsp:Transcript_14207/g.27140  ORF Transcript_14207/g.27140 Transcript_14207/m.27140 type:complete len:92 (-) Transcript_14207:160-435(-)